MKYCLLAHLAHSEAVNTILIMIADCAGGAEPMELARLEHPKVVNAAYFSPLTGSKVMTTCIDNR